MASLRPASRLLPHLTSTLRTSSQTTRSAPTSLRPILTITPRSQIHTTRSLLREDDNFGHTGRRVPQSPSHRTTPTDPASNDAYPDGPPGEPKPGESLSSGIPPSKIYTFEEIQSISATPDSHPNQLLIDVREPGELLEHGRIPNAYNLPIKTAPDAFFMSAEDFEDKYGYPRPSEEVEVIFYCKAGVRSKAAARLAGQAGFGGKYGEFPGSFDEWAAKGGKVQRE